MKKAFFGSSSLAAGLLVPAAALAEPPSSCPPGSWFCAEPPQAQAAPAGSAVQPLAPLPNPDHGAAPPPATATRPAAPAAAPPSSAAPPQAASEPPPPPPPEYQSPPGWEPRRPDEPPPYAYPYPQYGFAPPPPRLPYREWGVNLHLAAAAIGHGVAGNTGMGGGGFGLRYKPVPHFGLEADVDFYGGTDYQGNSRSEEAFSFNALFFINPRSMAQAYLLAGLGGSTAHVSCDPALGCGGGAFDAQYGYFGGQAGGGVELRLGRVVALNVDLRGFVRTRTDSEASSHPEFVNAFGQTSNTSAGALFTGGMTLYF
jgi:hypothetical protein